MTRRVVALGVAVLALAAAGCGSSSSDTSSDLAPSAERTEYGHITSLTRSGDHYELKLDPAWFLSGETANRAAAEDGVVEPGEPVPNDNYVVDEGDRTLTYLVPDDAKVTVLTSAGDPAQFGATEITVTELAEIVAGTSDNELFEPLDTGVWVTIDIDTVRDIHQQYRP